MALQNEVEKGNRYLGYFLPTINNEYYPKYSFRVHNWKTKDSFGVDLIHDGNGSFYINFKGLVFLFTVKNVHYSRKFVMYQGATVHEDFDKKLVELKINNQTLHEHLFEKTGYILLGSDTICNYEK